MCITFLIVFISFYLCCKLIAILTKRRCTSKKWMYGKIVLLTGANGGIGKEITKDLAMRGARIIMGCRNITTANEVKDEVVNETGNSNITVVKLDLSDLASVREFASEIIKTEPRLDVLIHCAGIYTHALPPEKQVTTDGIDISFATNHLGGFLLTHLLIDLLEKSKSGRIIVISSVLYHLSFKSFVKLDYKILAKESHLTRYATSKLANVLFTKELARRLEKTSITANCLHPGVIMTNITEHIDLVYTILYRLFRWTFKTTEEGAQTTIHLAVSDDVAKCTGKFFIDCHPFNISSSENGNARSLWMASEELVNLQEHERTIKDV